jgi:hypothetical protein
MQERATVKHAWCLLFAVSAAYQDAKQRKSTSPASAAHHAQARWRRYASSENFAVVRAEGLKPVITLSAQESGDALGFDLALMFSPCATHLGGARERILSAQNFTRPAASARHYYRDRFTTLVHLVRTRRRFQLRLLRRGNSRIERHILHLFRLVFVETTRIGIPGVVNSEIFTRA